MSKVTSPETSASIGFSSGITSGQASSLHSNGAVNTFVLLNVQAPSAENVAVKSMAPPSAGNTTSTKVCGEVKPTADTEAVPSPVKSNVPVVGASVNVIVISDVNVSSVKFVGVLLSLHGSTFDDVIAEISQTIISIVTLAVVQIVLSSSKQIVYSTI